MNLPSYDNIIPVVWKPCTHFGNFNIVEIITYKLYDCTAFKFISKSTV